MAREKFERTKPHVNIGTIGHVDHGKTTLTAAISATLAVHSSKAAKKFDEIDSAPEGKSKLTITVYPHILAGLPIIIAYLPHTMWVRPRLQKYLRSVLSGYEYYLQNGKAVPRNHYGRHPWFS